MQHSTGGIKCADLENSVERLVGGAVPFPASRSRVARYEQSGVSAFNLNIFSFPLRKLRGGVIP